MARPGSIPKGVQHAVPAPDLDHWLYVSNCRLPSDWTSMAITDIVAVSRARNATLGVTGALLFTGRRFSQFIEGPAGNVATIRSSIERDTRHGDVRTVTIDGPKARRFEDWSLAYAGPSLFVSEQVDAVIDDAIASARRLVQILLEFAAKT